MIICYSLEMLTVVIPTYNEEKTDFLRRILAMLVKFEVVEILIVDSHSTDNTRELISSFPKAKLIDCNTVSRASRLNLGIEQAANELILLHHPRSLLDPSAIEFLLNKKNLSWGGFTHKFDHKDLLLSFTSWYSNFIRADYRSIFYLDHCIFAQKSMLLKVGLIPDVDIFEDTEISKRLKTICKGSRFPFISKTSAIRFLNNGIIKQCFMNQKLKWKYYFKINHKVMNNEYEHGLGLNTNYSKTTKDE